VPGLGAEATQEKSSHLEFAKMSFYELQLPGQVPYLWVGAGSIENLNSVRSGSRSMSMYFRPDHSELNLTC
jgi:hypothetical protein